MNATESPNLVESPQPAKPVIKKMRWPFPAIWIVPFLAVLAAGFYFYDARRDRGPEIVITFEDGNGIKPGETPVSVHGVEVGKVSTVTLSDDEKHVAVHVLLNRTAKSLAKTGAVFWVVRPDFTNGNISGLGTIVSGPHIEALPGTGAEVATFTGAEEAPVILGNGLKVILHTDHVEHLQANSPVYFRGMQTGVVQDVRFSSDATGVNVTLFIWDRYRLLVRTDSMFWTVSGADVKGGLFSGLELKLQSIQSLISGGIAFASPEAKNGRPSGEAAEEGSNFVLHSEAKKEWEEWSPSIAITPDSSAAQTDTDTMKSGKEAVQSALEKK